MTRCVAIWNGQKLLLMRRADRVSQVAIISIDEKGKNDDGTGQIKELFLIFRKDRQSGFRDRIDFLVTYREGK